LHRQVYWDYLFILFIYLVIEADASYVSFLTNRPKAKLTAVCLWCISHRYKTARSKFSVKILSTEAKRAISASAASQKCKSYVLCLEFSDKTHFTKTKEAT